MATDTAINPIEDPDSSGRVGRYDRDTRCYDRHTPSDCRGYREDPRPSSSRLVGVTPTTGGWTQPPATDH